MQVQKSNFTTIWDQVVHLDFVMPNTLVAYGCWEGRRGPDERGINRPAAIAVSLDGARKKKKPKY